MEAMLPWLASSPGGQNQGFQAEVILPGQLTAWAQKQKSCQKGNLFVDLIIMLLIRLFYTVQLVIKYITIHFLPPKHTHTHTHKEGWKKSQHQLGRVGSSEERAALSCPRDLMNKCRTPEALRLTNTPISHKGPFPQGQQLAEAQLVTPK